MRRMPTFGHLIWEWTLLPLLLVAPLLAQTPVPPLPSPQQLAWHRLRTYAFVHFGPNTFTGLEWGHGTERPGVFNPSALDCGQWVRTFKAAGLKGVILTAKHHDGFCLWPSSQSTHTVAQSPWRGGKGDVLRELAAACKVEGLKLGVYLSPWDRNHPAYGTPAYNDVFVRMLEEVLGSYGDMFEVWFDGACGEGPNGKRQVYDWARFNATVRRLQPHAVIFSDAGPDVRWVGNERGEASERNWALLRREEFVPGTDRSAELAEGHEDGTAYLPAECDVSIRPGWFWREAENAKVKTPEVLEDLFYASVGRGASLLLNVPPDIRGRIHETDVASLLAFGATMRATFARDLALGARLSGDGRIPKSMGETTPWVAEQRTGTLNLDLGKPKTFNVLHIEESVALGQRIRRFVVEAQVGSLWIPLAKGTTLGAHRLFRIASTTARHLRLRVLEARGTPMLSRFSLHVR